MKRYARYMDFSRIDPVFNVDGHVTDESII